MGIKEDRSFDLSAELAKRSHEHAGYRVKVVSGSALTDFSGEKESCERKWWFQRSLKIPTPPRKSSTFGTVHHGVVERWLKADDNGVSDEVLYPPGWDEKITPEEASTIQKLVAQAIKDGFLHRAPGRMIEEPVLRLLGKDEETKTAFYLFGFIDLGTPDTIEDHKTTSSPRWCKSTEKLGADRKMLLYAWELMQRNQRLQEVTLRFTYYLKPPHMKVKAVEVKALRPLVMATAQYAIDDARRMARMEKIPEEEWGKVPCSMDEGRSSTACTAYGGCHFMEVCTGRESLKQYRNRMVRIGAAQAPAPQPPNPTDSTNPTKETMPMSILGRLAAATQVGNAPAATPAPTPPPAATPAPTPPPVAVTPPAPKKAAAPWAYAACTSCNGVGLTPKGVPCRVCDDMQARAGNPTSAFFDLEIKDGKIRITPKPVAPPPPKEPEFVFDPTPEPSPSKEVVAAATVAAALTPTIAPAPPRVEEAPAETPKPFESVAETVAKRKRGPNKPKEEAPAVSATPVLAMGERTVFIGALIDGGKHQTLAGVMERVREGYKAEKGVSLWELDVWKRRDVVTQIAPDVWDAIGSSPVFVPGLEGLAPDERALLDGLVSTATTVIRAVK